MLPLSLGIVLAIISLVGFCLNVYILIVLVLTKQVTPNNILLVHLSAAQSLLSLIFLVFSFPPIVQQGTWIASIEFTCIINGFLFTILHPISLWTICGLNCDRYYAIAAPLHYSAIVTNRKVIVGLIGGWIVIFVLSIPPFFKVAPFKFSTNMGACLPNFATHSSLWYAIIFTSVTLVIPAIVIIGCNIKVLMIARYHRHRIAAAIYEVTLSAQVTITHQRNPFFVPTVTAPGAGGPKFRSRSPITMVLQLVGSFVVLYVPFFATVIWDSTSLTIYGAADNVPDSFKTTNKYVVIVAATLLTCSPAINSVLYGLKSKTIRKSFQHYWRLKRTKNEMQQEIQARTPSTCGSRRPSMSNLGFLTRPLLQRRLSETLIDIDRRVNGAAHRPRMKRIASELTWRPISLTFPGLESPPLPSYHPKAAATSIPHTSSCNTLQVPSSDVDMISEEDQEFYNTLRNSFRASKQTGQSNPRLMQSTVTVAPSATCHQQKATLGTANFLLHKVLRLDPSDQSKRLILSCSISNGSCSSHKCKALHSDRKRTVFASPLKSPRILITRAMSDESDSKTPSLPGTPAKERSQRQYCSSSRLNECGVAKWTYLHGTTQENSEEVDSDEMKTCLDDNSAGSNSTDISEISHHRRYSSLEETSGYSREIEIDSAAEEQLLLSWPVARKKLKGYTVGSRNGIFRPSPIFNDRCEEPEVVL